MRTNGRNEKKDARNNKNNIICRMSYLRLSINYLLSGVYGIIQRIERLYAIYLYCVHCTHRSQSRPIHFVTKGIPVPLHFINMPKQRTTNTVYMNSQQKQD